MSIHNELNGVLTRSHRNNQRFSEAVVANVNDDGTYDLNFKGNSGLMKSVEYYGTSTLTAGMGVLVMFLEGQRNNAKILQPTNASVTGSPLSFDARSGSPS